MARREKALGPDHPDTLMSVYYLAALHSTRRDYAAAEPLLKRVVAGWEKALGPDHPLILKTVHDLAGVYRARGDHAAAEPLYRRVVAGREKALGPDHPDTLTSVHELAVLYWSMGRLDRSIPLFEDAVRRYKAKLGDDHPDTLNAIANLGVNYKDAGRVAEAVPLLERAHQARTKHPRLNGVGGLLLDAYTKAGRPADAARLAGERLAEARRTLKPGSPELGGRLLATGKTLLGLDPVAAEPVLREYLAVREKLAPAAWTTANAKSMLGEALLLQKKYADAEPLLTAGYAGLLAAAKTIPSVSRRNLPDAADRLVGLYLKLKKPAEVAKWQAERGKYPPEPAPRPRRVG